MATGSVTAMLREISAAGDRERTGALDVEWDGTRVSLFFMFGHPSHVMLETTDGRKVAGEEALTALVDELPAEFRVAPWRRAMVTEDSLHCSTEELMALFAGDPAQANGHAADPPAASTELSAGVFASQTDGAPLVQEPTATNQPPFGMSDFPLLPLGAALWSDSASNVVHLEAVVPRLPDCLLSLTDPTCQAATLVADGRIVDAVWVDASTGLVGDEAAQALMSSTEGTVSAHRIDDRRVVAVLPLLWRSPRPARSLPADRLRIDDIVAEIRDSGRSCALLVGGDEPGTALFCDGELIAVYSAGDRRPATTMTALRSLVDTPDAEVSVLAGADVPSAQPTPLADPITGESTTPDVSGAEELAAADAFVDEEVTLVDVFVVEEVKPTVVAVEDGVASSGTAIEEDEVSPAQAAVDDDAASTAGSVSGEESTARETDAAVVGVVVPDTDELAPTEPTANGGEVPAGATETDDATEALVAEEHPEDVSSAEADDLWRGPGHFEPAIFSIQSLESEEMSELTEMQRVEAREAKEFVPARLDIDIDSLRDELTDIAVVWLGADDAAPVAQAIVGTRPGVDDFVYTIAAIGAMEIPGHENAVVRAMAREMHFRATEVLCGV